MFYDHIYSSIFRLKTRFKIIFPFFHFIFSYKSHKQQKKSWSKFDGKVISFSGSWFAWELWNEVEEPRWRWLWVDVSKTKMVLLSNIVRLSLSENKITVRRNTCFCRRSALPMGLVVEGIWNISEFRLMNGVFFLYIFSSEIQSQVNFKSIWTL